MSAEYRTGDDSSHEQLGEEAYGIFLSNMS